MRKCGAGNADHVTGGCGVMISAVLYCVDTRDSHASSKTVERILVSVSSIACLL